MECILSFISDIARLGALTVMPLFGGGGGWGRVSLLTLSAKFAVFAVEEVAWK